MAFDAMEANQQRKPAASSPAVIDSEPSTAAKRDSAIERIQRGRELFLHRWKPADVSNPMGDGLGPVFNGRSCAECHNQSRPGGAGSNDHNVDVLSVVAPGMRNDERKEFIERLTAIDAAFTADTKSALPNIPLHKFGTDPDYAEWRSGVLNFLAKTEAVVLPAKRKVQETDVNERAMQFLREARLGTSSNAKPAAAEAKVRSKPDHLRLILSHRSTPALFGAGLIDRIADDVLRATAQAQADQHTMVKGRVAVAGGRRPGRFGWRGQTASLKEFVMGACANELGLQVPGHNQGVDPLDPTYRAPGLDLTQEQCDDLTEFVASLPRPEQRQPKNPEERDLWQAGENVFEMVGCANCHVRTLGNVEGLYSDLLLHDLGPKLADPSGATPSSGSSQSTGRYNGGSPDIFIDVPAITQRQWRTAPLWGVADSAPYMHDGRAETLDEAIKAHGGEAAASERLYSALPSAERVKLIGFLNSLAAPQEASRIVQD